jgi:hypothetical protein
MVKKRHAGRPFGTTKENIEKAKEQKKAKNTFREDLLYVYSKWGGKKQLLTEVKDSNDKSLKKLFLQTLLQLHVKELDIELKKTGAYDNPGGGKNFIFVMSGLKGEGKVIAGETLSVPEQFLKQITSPDEEVEIERDDTTITDTEQNIDDTPV